MPVVVLGPTYERRIGETGAAARTVKKGLSELISAFSPLVDKLNSGFPKLLRDCRAVRPVREAGSSGTTQEQGQRRAPGSKRACGPKREGIVFRSD